MKINCPKLSLHVFFENESDSHIVVTCVTVCPSVINVGQTGLFS
jgi:hypothetical protein